MTFQYITFDVKHPVYVDFVDDHTNTLAFHNSTHTFLNETTFSLSQTLNELKILEVSLPDGAEACWVFLSCLEVLRTCERYSDSSEMENYSLQTANLWAYAREKLLHLGENAGNMSNN